MYIEHVLRVRVDWSTLRSINKKIRQIRDALSTKKPVEIPYSPIPDWFRQNHKLVDEPRCLLPLDKIPKRPRWRCCRVERNLLWEITGSLATAGNDLRVGKQLLFSKPKIIIKKIVFNRAHTKDPRPTSSIQR